MAGKTNSEGRIGELFKAGAHFGFVKSRRHPSALPFIFGQKNKVEIFDLEKTNIELQKALDYVKSMGKENAQVIFVGGKSEAREAIKAAGRELNMSFVHGRWIGGTLTNFSEIKKRLQKFEELTTQREKGELGKYTKKERLLIDREIAKLEVYFGGIASMKGLPKFLVVIDPKKESIAISEAKRMKIPVVALAGSDVNLYEVDHAIPGNDSSRQAIAFILGEIVAAYKEGQKEAVPKEAVPAVQA
ncbi:MAG: rpsB [Parcubacteria group bacterium]|nr:rpsB [Parcubacteria group bacterium]